MIYTAYAPGGQALAQLILTLFRVNNLALTWGDRIVAPLGLTSARWQVMGAVAARPQPVAWLARDLGAQRQSVQRIINDLRDLGFVELEQNPHHRRSPVVVLTETGAKRIADAMHTYAPIVESLSEDLKADSVANAQRTLEALRVCFEQRLVTDRDA